MVETKAPVANLLAIIALFFVLYVIILPSQDKAKLIDDPSVVGNEGISAGGNAAGNVELTGDYENARTLLVESPGVVKPYNENLGAQPISSVKLFTSQATETSTLASAVTVKRGIFSNSAKKFTFNVENLETVASAKLYFLVIKQKGNLMIEVNGQQIYEGVVQQGDLPIEIPKDSLRSKNTIELSASSPGFAFLTTNSVELKDVQVVKKNSVENKAEQRSFILDDTEIGIVKKASLNYFINCLSVNELGTLNIYLNDRLVSTRFVVCDAKPVFLDMDTKFMQAGRNVLKFEIDKGDYIIEQVLLQKLYEQKSFPIFFFPVQIQEYDALQSGSASAAVFMKFPDDGYRKKATVLVNGVPVYLDTYSSEFAFDVSDFLIQGENFAKIIPATEFNVLDLEIALR